MADETSNPVVKESLTIEPVRNSYTLPPPVWLTVEDAVWRGQAADLGCDEVANNVFAAIEAAGYRVVPTKPTAAMVQDGADAIYGHTTDQDAKDAWEAMLAAAPKVTP